MKLLAALLLVILAAPSPQMRYFRFERAVAHLPPSSGQACFVIDPEVFAHAAPRLTDLRLYRDGNETPYMVGPAAPEQSAEQSIPLLNLGRRGGETVFDAAMPEVKYSDVQLGVAGHDFIATVTVSGSQTAAGSSATRLGAYTIFDLSRQKLGRSTVLHLPQSTFSYLHFRIAGPIPPDSVTGLSVPRQPASPPKYAPVARSTRIVQKGRSSAIEFTVPARTPIDRIAFALGEQPPSFSRDVSIVVTPIVPRSTDAADGPGPVASFGNILRVHGTRNGRRIDEERLAIDAPSAEFDTPAKWTITVENGDDPPIQIDSVTLQMRERTVCFEATGGAHYELYYGDPALAAPRYDYAKLFAPQPDAAQAALGPEQRNSIFQPRPDDRPFTEKHPVLLWVVLILVIALLGVIALRTMKQAPRPPE